MEQKITGIVLHTLKYNDTSNIVDIYTEQSGRASFLVKIPRSRKSGVQTVLFQPLSIIEVEADVRPAGAKIVCGLDDIMTQPINGSGCNEKYGLLGSNKSTEDKVKLFPRDCQDLVENVQARILEKTGKHVEVMVYGDGAFKDPKGKIWELADPVVSPAFTSGLVGTPNELKLKYLADNDFSNLSGEELKKAISESIRAKDGSSLVGNMAAQGTTPRQLTDLIGSLCDLTSGSGDKGTPVVLVQGYFDNYTT